jgi:tetratricopeptide (TPR) repeat protein
MKPFTSNEFVERGKLHEKQRHDQLAIEDYTKAIEVDERNLTAVFRRAILYTSLKDYINAENDYTRYIALDRSSAFVFSNRALILLAQGRTREALLDLNTALEIEPFYEQALISRAKILLS